MKKLFLFLLLTFFLGAAGGRLYAQKTINRDSFSLKYPDSWSIDTEDEDYDPDELFSLDAPDGNGMVMFIFMDVPVELDELLNEQDKNIRANLMKEPSEITSFTQWGNYRGKGKSFKGKFSGALEGEVNIFVCQVGGSTLYIMEQLFEEKMEEVRSGLKLISSSFRFKTRQ